MRLFCHADSNALVIGHNNCWLVNAVTSHRRHQVGTKRVLKIRPGSQEVFQWEKLAQLVHRHASPGANVNVYVLHPTLEITEPIAQIVKT